jgi:RsiW-degrading membrane proteinase PrsW (M82 family)
MLVAVGVPCVFLYTVKRLDLYASGSFDTVAMCFAGGLVAFPAAFVLNTTALGLVQSRSAVGLAAALVITKTVIAPILEEILKGSPVVAATRRRDFTYFVDGAIYGFAAGTAFAIFENLFYVRASAGGQALGLSVNRALSTSLLHGAATALIGVSLGRFRFSRGSHRAAGLLAGWLLAVSLHMTFNRVVTGAVDTQTVIVAMVLGFSGLGLTMAFIKLGLRDERLWLRQTLGLGVGVTSGEAAVIDRIKDLKAILQPVEEHFGRERRDRVERLVADEARLGLKRKAADMAEGTAARAALEEDIRVLLDHIDLERRAIGVFCMLYVRAILPREDEYLWAQLEAAIANSTETGYDIWQVIAARTGQGEGPTDGLPSAGV